MKRIFIILFCLPLFAVAQDKPLIAEGSSSDLYLIHTVAAKENYYSIGRIYNISPKEYAPYNNLSMSQALALGQKIKIPLSKTNFLQSGTPDAGEVLVPVYHTVKDKEGLYKISAGANKLPVATLKKWNHLSGETVNNGTNLIIGYLRVKKDLSPLASQAIDAPGLDNSAPTETAEAVAETHKPVTPVTAPSKKIINKEVVADQPKQEEVQVKPAQKTKYEAPVTSDAATSGDNYTSANNYNFRGGAFKPDYNKQIAGQSIAKENGAAAIFKSTSGWEDGKYYCLYNSAQAGSIVKVTNAANGRSIYAKVLDLIPDIKQNNGITIRISNSAAEQLGVSNEDKFDCMVEYSK